MGGGRCSKINKRDNSSRFEYELIFVAIIKNEAPYLDEWIRFHHLLGVEKFIIYDNESTDNPLPILNPYIDKGWVEYMYWQGKAQQVVVYTDALNRYRKNTRYIGFVDLDEFVYPIKGNNIKDFVHNTLLKYSQAGGVCIPWYNYGTSGIKTAPQGLVIENYLQRADYGFIVNVKTIGNPRLMKCCLNPHIPIWKYGTCNIDEWGRKNRGTKALDNRIPSEIRINHYYTKSEEEYWNKIARGMADGYEKRPQDIGYFDYRNRNEIEDTEILRFVYAMKKDL